MWKGRFWLIDLTTLYDRGTYPVHEGKGCGLAYLCYGKAFPTTVSHSILWEKLAAQGLDKCILYWVKNQDCWAQKVNGVTSNW